jgi:hypothetical protein
VEEAHKPLLHPSLTDMTKQKSRVGNNSKFIKLLNKKDCRRFTKCKQTEYNGSPYASTRGHVN